MCWRQIDREASCIEFIVTLGIFNRGREKTVKPAQFLALCVFESVEAVHKPGIG